MEQRLLYSANMNIPTMYHSFCGAVCAGAVALITSSGQAQNLFEADNGSGNVYEFTPGGARSTFASGFSALSGLAFNSAGDLFVADAGSGDIYKFTPNGNWTNIYTNTPPFTFTDSMATTLPCRFYRALLDP